MGEEVRKGSDGEANEQDHLQPFQQRLSDGPSSFIQTVLLGDAAAPTNVVICQRVPEMTPDVPEPPLAL